MKKSKIVIMTVLALMLCLLCVCYPTFSWYTRPEKLTGNSLSWSANYPVSDGTGVTMQTYESSDGGANYDAQPTNLNGATITVPANGRLCYRTDITNTGTSAQSVSLFLSQLSANGTTTNFDSIYVGVNDPLKTHKSIETEFTGTVTANNDTIRVYFNTGGFTNYESSYEAGNKYIVRYSTTSADPTTESPYAELKDTGGTEGSDNHRPVYYADIPVTAKRMYFSVLDGYDGLRTAIIADFVKNGFTQTSTKMVYPSGGGTEQAYNYGTYTPTGANIADYYQVIYLTKDSTFDAKLTDGNYMGSLTYGNVSNSNVISLNGSVITAKSAGTATFTTTATGGYTDTYQVTTKVVVRDSSSASAASDVPIITNVKVNAKDADTGDATVQSIYWYIENKDTADKKYTISDIYLSL